MIDLPTVVGMTPEERKRHLGPQYRRGKGSASQQKVTGFSPFVGEVAFWAVVIGVFLFFSWRPW